MMSRSRLIFVIFYLTAVLILTVHIRTASRRVFNRARAAKVRQKTLLVQLRSKQLELETLLTPQAVSEQAPEELPQENP